jgi:hypothetical protein
MKNASNWKTFNSVTPGIEEIGGRNLLAARSMCKLWLPEGKSEGPPQWRMDCLDVQNPEDDAPRAPRPDKSVWRSRRDSTTPSFRMQNIHQDAKATLSDGCKASMRRLLIHERTSHSLTHNRFLPEIGSLASPHWRKGLGLQPVSAAYWVGKMGSGDNGIHPRPEWTSPHDCTSWPFCP